MTPDQLSALAARVSDEVRPSSEQQLVSDLWTALQTLIAEASAPSDGDPGLVEALRAQVADLENQVRIANLALTEEQGRIAQLMAEDAAKIADLTGQTQELSRANALLATDKADLLIQLTKALGDLAAAQKNYSDLQAQYATATQALDVAQQTIGNLNAQIVDLKRQIAQMAVNHPPKWDATVPTLNFVSGQASAISVAQFVSDPDGDPLTLLKNANALPPGVTFDAPNKRFVYDGTPVASSIVTPGHMLTASDGKAA